MKTSDLEWHRDVASEAARSAAEVLMRHFRVGLIAVQHKEKGNLENIATVVDDDAQAAAAAVIAQYFPTAFIVAEESVGPATLNGTLAGESLRHSPHTKDWIRPPQLKDLSEYWLIDALDGTNNYVHGIPFFGASIAFVRNRTPVVGVSFAPSANDLFSSFRGGGARLNGKPIHVGSGHSLEGAIIGCDSPRLLDFQPWPKGLTLRVLGSPVLTMAFVAAGWLEGYIFAQRSGVQQRMGPWDVAAGQILIEEAGGVVRQQDGAPFDFWKRGVVAASSPEVYAQLHHSLQNVS
jgi:myo-inositol-1(or 4)-monophosphatase